MATDTASLASEIEALTAPLIASGKFANTSEVVRAAIDALQKQLDEQAYDEACVRAAEEGEASGLIEGDIFEMVRAKYGLKSRIRP
jgi:Arc/MetJ-type ribon-helix-helix transcriptional regulator